MNFGTMRTLMNDIRLRPGAMLLAGTLTLTTAASALAAQSQRSALTNQQARTTADAPKLKDQNIIDAVEDELLLDDFVPAYRVDATISNGILTLRGTVNNILAKDRTTRIAETVKGVRGVVNLIKVDPAVDMTADTLRRLVNDALLADPATESYDVKVQATDAGAVTLTGTVDSWQERQLAEKVTKGVTGVTEVRNNIKIDYPAGRSDYDIRADIERTFDFSTMIDDALIGVEVDNGQVTLTGTVGSAAEKARARTLAWVAGVTDVDAEKLEVHRWARDPDLRGDKYVTRADTEVNSAVQMALLYDPRVNSFDITSTVDNGTVTLRGIVDNLKAKRAAERDATNIVGVRNVRNRIDVRTQQAMTDTSVAETVRSAFKRDPLIDREEIDVTFADGTVNLYGTVDTYFDKAHADDVAAQFRGVQQVNNNLVVRDVEWIGFDPFVDEWPVYEYTWYDYDPGTTWAADAEIREEINDELFWSPFVDSDEVFVTVDDGVATLTGTVDSWSEYDAAADNAFEGGAVWVDNELVVNTQQ